MNLRGLRSCSKHPSQLVVGVCAACLRERLAVLANVEEVDANSSMASSPRHSVMGDPIVEISTQENICSKNAAQEDVCAARKQPRTGIAAASSIPCPSHDAFVGNRPSDASPTRRFKKNTLFSLFHLDDAETVKIEQSGDGESSKQIVNGFKTNEQPDGSCSAHQNRLQIKFGEHEPKRSRHGSFSERVEAKSSLFPVAEDGRKLSWFSSLFSRQRKKSRRRSMETMSTFSEHHGWEDARASWEAPRHSSWEQLRFSTWEMPRSSWEPARPSWDPVLGGLEFCNDSLWEVREDAELECKGFEDLVGFNSTTTAAAGGEASDIRKIAHTNASSHIIFKTPPHDEREKGKKFVPAKTMQLQRDVSTQTTPPRSSDATQKVFMQQMLQEQQQHHHHQQIKGRAPAAWSKVWTKTFSNPKWACKQKHKNGLKEQEAIAVTEARDYAGTMSGSVNHSQSEYGNRKEAVAWNVYCSPEPSSGVVRLHHHQQQQDKKNAHKGENGDRSSTSSFSPFNLENGLLRFYLTPVRSGVSGGRSRQRNYAPWL